MEEDKVEAKEPQASRQESDKIDRIKPKTANDVQPSPPSADRAVPPPTEARAVAIRSSQEVSPSKKTGSGGTVEGAKRPRASPPLEQGETGDLGGPSSCTTTGNASGRSASEPPSSNTSERAQFFELLQQFRAISDKPLITSVTVTRRPLDLWSLWSVVTSRKRILSFVTGSGLRPRLDLISLRTLRSPIN